MFLIVIPKKCVRNMNTYVHVSWIMVTLEIKELTPSVNVT